MSEPDGPDATRRTLIRGVVVLGAVGAGAGLSFIGDGTYKAASTESDVATQAPAPVETAAPEPTASAKPTKATKPAASAKPTKADKSAKATTPTKADTSATAKKPTKPAKVAKPAGKALGPSNKIPVGSGVIYKADKVVVTQPTKGTYKAFDATCTHAACLVDKVDTLIHCPCHSAKFSITDGSPVKPSVARRPLPPKTVTEADGTIYLT